MLNYFIKATFILTFVSFSHSLRAEELSLGDKLDDLGKIYQGDSSELVQEAWLLGRYHGQYYWAKGDDESTDQGFETRRLRLGGQVKLINSLTLHAQMVSGSDVNPFYNGFTELWSEWKFSDAFRIAIGQQKHRFTHDRNVSSRYINYLERGVLTNMFSADYTPAVTAQGKLDNLNYYTGVFSNATGSNMKDAFTELDSGWSYLGAMYYQLNCIKSLDTAYLHTSYVHSEAKENATNFNRFDNGLSGAFIITKNSFSLVNEIVGGLSDKGNVIGLNFQPTYFLTNKTQLALRYQIAGSNDEEGISAQKRYERDSGLSKGNLYNAAYIGLNYYVAKHRIKLMTGLEYSTLGGEEVITASTMFRFFFGPHSGGAFPMNQMLPGGLFEYD